MLPNVGGLLGSFLNFQIIDLFLGIRFTSNKGIIQCQKLIDTVQYGLLLVVLSWKLLSVLLLMQSDEWQCTPVIYCRE